MPDKYVKIQLSQLNFIVGDLDFNCQKILDQYKLATNNQADLVIFSELAITGYPPQDLLHKKYFLDEIEAKISLIKQATIGKNTAILLGCPYITNPNSKSSSSNQCKIELYNSAFLIEEGKITAIAHKTCLPNWGVFDEQRYFKAAPSLVSISLKGLRLAVLICEDIWQAKNAFLLNDKIFDCIISLNGSPFNAKKDQERLFIIRKFIKDLKKPVIYLNQVGGQDALVFDGGSFVLDQNGEIILKMKEFEEDSQAVKLYPNFLDQESEQEIRIESSQTEVKFIAESENSKEFQIYNAIILGLKDYVNKNGFKNVVIGISGGIDSALVSTIAVDALGAQNVKLLALPSKFNSPNSFIDAKNLADNLSIKLEQIDIEPIFEVIKKSLQEQFKNQPEDTTEENLQSRIRGNILMAISNKFGNLLLSTGNKSELAVGYATIYGDMCGGFNPIKDVYKTEVFALANWRNQNIPILSYYPKTNLIPLNIINKPPSAELRENQKDSDFLPEYEVLDQILYQLIEEEKSVVQIIKLGFAEELVKKIASLFFNNEYKRSQAVIGPKVSSKSFDQDRRYPITNKFKK